ncbi:cyclic GMP-AMP synthase DncV-like nucleotidyltransferase [Flammeovirga sp. EKP202]|uniref:cyclic GMP-AMP synthase DncV-like nucleotidyltransferase n=1 Tax=Flammeovirga sp. EKP202 TaxID=2770592 RepID=UPI00165FDAF9|nr:nucleotidyltransferase [Flammeovirga sp. EKP202]MBD0405297.1 nucleotidyltransferase [Flammeovirga sp. EKP202]
MDKQIQKCFQDFHDEIRIKDLDRVEESNKILREKRDLLLNDIKKYFDNKNLTLDQNDQIKYQWFNQGSYAMYTGVKPIDDGDFDIDVAIVLDINKDDYSNPTIVKKWIFDALDKKANRTVKWKKPCITVQYTKAGEDMYHVDFAIYAGKNSDEKYYLARGKETSLKAEKRWDESSPKELKEKINDKFLDTEQRKQFKRIIKYLKRWKEEAFKGENSGSGKPTGIALTALTYDHFSPFTKNVFTNELEVNDLEALIYTVNQINNSSIWSDIKVHLPVSPYNNLFSEMTPIQMQNFKDKLTVLKTKLVNARDNIDPHEASKIISSVLGPDFPIIKKETISEKSSRPAITSSGESA